MALRSHANVPIGTYGAQAGRVYEVWSPWPGVLYMESRLREILLYQTLTVLCCSACGTANAGISCSGTPVVSILLLPNRNTTPSAGRSGEELKGDVLCAGSATIVWI